MSEYKFNFDFSVLGVGFWSTVILAILKIANVIDISTWLVLTPLLVVLGYVFILVFIIGVITIYLFATHSVNKENEEDEDSEE